MKIAPDKPDYLPQGTPLSHGYNRNLIEVRRLSREMLDLAGRGDMERHDNGCGIIFSVLRDAAYRLKELTSAEIVAHKQGGLWDDSDDEEG